MSNSGANLAGAYGRLATAMAPTTRVRSRAATSNVITTFQSGHGFVSGSADATSNLNDTTVSGSLGSQCATIVTAGAGAAATLGKTGLTAVDLTGKNIRLRLRVSTLLHCSKLEVYAGTGGLANIYKWTGFYKAEVNPQVNYSKDGEWVWLDLSFRDAIVTGAPNRASIDAWQLRAYDDAGAKITVNWQGIYAVPVSTTYPNGVVSLTWDDSVQSPLLYAKPRQDLYDFMATYYPILDLLGTNTAGVQYFSEADLTALYEQGNDVALHSDTLAHHNLTNGFIDLAQADREAAFQYMKDWNRQRGFVRGSDHWASPQGKFDATMISTCRKYFASHRTVVSNSMETVRPSDPMRLRVIPLPALGNGITAANVTTAIDDAYANGAWLILLGHQVVTGSSVSSLQCTQTDWNTICDKLATKGIPVRTVHEVLANVA